LTHWTVALALCVGLVACDNKPAAPPAPGNSSTGAGTGESSEREDHHAGPVIELGTGTIGAFTVKATRDQGEIIAGRDAPIDVTVTGPAGGAKVVSVRFWIGTGDAKGSVKARGEIEDPSEPNRWHTHAEIPSPMPAGSKLWVEIETDAPQTVTGSFDLKQ